MKGLPTETVTLLFTDIEGSTALLQHLGDRRYAEVLDEHRRVLRTVFAKEDGQEISTAGDAFLVAFSQARKAVAAAVEAQRALSVHLWPEGVSVRVRMGLHTGEPITEIGDYVGLDVHRASRICSVGYGGQILVSQAVGARVSLDFPPGVSLRDLGTHRLKDLKTHEHLFQVVHPDIPTDFPPLRSLDARPNNLPIQLTSFIGREREIEEVKRCLGVSRLVNIMGSGGAGKTRLALQAAADLVEGYRDGVWLVELAPMSDPSLVPRAVASAVGASEQPWRAPIETLTEFLRDKSVLILLDNCEHMLAACAYLTGALLRVCPNLKILATSREALKVTGETTWRIPPLSIPDSRHLPSTDRLSEYDSVRLFVDRAAAITPHFAVTMSNVPAIAQICHCLDGIPLAIELAAARVKVLAVEQIAARLDDRFRLLTEGSRNALPRQQTLRGVMDWSFDLLSTNERVLFRRLSVFAGGWALEAAETVCSGNEVEASEILDLLTHLVDKSLVVAETGGNEARYRLLETVRQYAKVRLDESGEFSIIRRNHCNWYLGLAEQAATALQGSHVEEWLARLETEHDNFRAALTWSQTEPPDAEPGLRLAGALWWFWFLRGYWTEGRRWLEVVVSSRNAVAPATLAPALLGASVFAWRRGDNEAAATLGAESLALYEASIDKHGIALALQHLGYVASDRGEDDRALALSEQSFQLCKELGDRWLSTFPLVLQGQISLRRGDLDRAAACFEESLALRREAGDRSRLASSLGLLGKVALARGDYVRGSTLYKEGLTVSRSLGDKHLIARCLEGLAYIAALQSDPQRAMKLLGASEVLREAMGFAFSPADRQEIDNWRTQVRSRLGEAATAAAITWGRNLTLSEAVEYGLELQRT